jgi:hypothetical protein
MMFMMPIPPTSREIPATAVTTAVSCAVALPRASEICLVLRIEKSSALLAVMLRRSRSSRLMESWMGPLS